MNQANDPAAIPPREAVAQAAPQPDAKPAKKEESFFVFLIKLVAIVLIFRSFIFAPFNIPSESMLPVLRNGDYLLAAKWPYGFSRYSLPLSAPLIPGRILPSQPHRGDIAIFKAPPLNDTDYIKRVIGLPGDQVQMIAGTLHLNGAAVPKVRVADAVVPVTANTRCYMPVFEVTAPDGTLACHYPRFRETLPAIGDEPGKSYYVLDLGRTPQDDTPPFVVPAGALFMMGDNRDNSMDSRFPPVPGGGIGLIPQQNLVGKATIMMFSTDGSSSWLKPWTWPSATRWDRIGHTF
ncbi:MAG: signal peptidase I [Pseudomonadota bacterium]